MSNGPQFAYLIMACIVLGLAIGGMVWVGKVIRGELGAGADRGANHAGWAMPEEISPATMKEAIAKGLVVPSQLAGMTEMERTFLFSSLKQKLATPAPAASQLSAQAATPAPPVAPPPPAPEQPPAAMPADIPPAMLAILNAEKFRAWCSLCGTELQLPAFPPLLARCSSCGMKSAIRQEEGGRYVVNVSPPPKTS